MTTTHRKRAGLSSLVICRRVQKPGLTEGRRDIASGAGRPNRMIQPTTPTPKIPVARTDVARPSTRPERRYRLVTARKKPVNVSRAKSGSVYGEESTAGVGGRRYRYVVSCAKEREVIWEVSLRCKWKDQCEARSFDILVQHDSSADESCVRSDHTAQDHIVAGQDRTRVTGHQASEETLCPPHPLPCDPHN
jgi:hypothetical protein